MNPFPSLPILEFVITGFGVVGILLPALGAVVLVLPYLTATLIALVRRDPGGPFIPHSHAHRSRTLGLTCLFLGILALVAVQPHYFRPAAPSAATASMAASDPDRARIAPDVLGAMDSAGCAGVVVAIVDSSGTRVLGFGRSSLDREAAPDGRSVFEIGSLTQVLTTSLFARMVEEGAVRVDQSLQSLLPDSVSVPAQGERAIELGHLASFSSGLPRFDSQRMLPFLDLFPPFSRVDASCSVASAYRLLSSIEIENPPGTRIDGSDFGVGLLGHALERAAGVPYDTLLQSEICGPLRMKDTRVRLTPSMHERLTPGMVMGWGAYKGWRVASPTRRWQRGGLVGARDLCSTANDLAAFLGAQLGLRPSPLVGALAETRRPRFAVAKAPDVALGWLVDHSPVVGTIVWQEGAAGACRSYMGMVESRGMGVVVLANGPIDARTLGLGILSRLGPPTS